MLNSNVPQIISISCFSELHRNYRQVKILILSSVRSNKHMVASLSALCERSDYKLVHLNFRSITVRLYSFNSLWTLNDGYNNFQERSNTYHISEPITGRVFPNLVLVRSLRSSFIIHSAPQTNAATLRKVLAPFFGLSCDCDRFLFPFISEFLSLFFPFLIL